MDEKCEDGEVRLKGGSAGYEGRVDVCVNGQLGTICDRTWDYKAASVVCSQLGYPAEGASQAMLHKALYSPCSVLQGQ